MTETRLVDTTATLHAEARSRSSADAAVLRRVGDLADLVRRQLEQDWRSANQLGEVCRYALAAPGKLFRPVLLLESAGVVGGDVESVLPAAAGTEAAHVASLMHDDIIDGDRTRRGVPATHVVFGADGGIVGGDALIFYLFEGLAACAARGVDASRIVVAMDRAAVAGADLCRGQMLEEAIRQAYDTRVSSYLDMIDNKTGALFRACCEIGVTLAGGTPTQAAAMARYGTCLGMAFQIQDDLLPYVSTESETGKAPWSDLANRRLTLPLLLLRAEAGPAVQAQLDDLVNGSEPVHLRYDELRRLLLDRGVLERAAQVADAYTREALEALDLFPDSPSRTSLLHFAHAAVRRVR